jgi:hypothetical protein
MERSESENLSTNVGSEQSNFASSSNESTSFGDVPSTTDQGGFAGRAKSVASTVKQKASNIPSMLADGLEAGAQALRQNKLGLATTDGSTAASTSSDSSITAVTDTLATGMQSSADWLRDADLEKLKSGVEQQVKEHPARTLLVALGAGYLIGKALRR